MPDQKLKDKARTVHKLFNKHYPDSACTLDFTNPIELVVATILSAQCTDERVRIVTKDLFKKYKKPQDYADAEPAELENDIHSTGFYRNKAKNIQGFCRLIIEKHNGKVPSTLEELVALPGIGRKTANVVLGNSFGVPGIVIDTHAGRVSQRIGLTNNEDPVKIEFDLMELFPKKDWTRVSHQMIDHGRSLCDARKPRCPECFLLNLCDYGAKAQK